MIYSWKSSSRISADPQTVGEEIENLKESSDGVVTPAQVVDAARNSKSSLHSYFDWNDKTAASKYREEQAKYILRNLVVRIDIPDSETPVVTRAFVSVQIKKDDEVSHAYTPVMTALSKDDWRAQVIGEVVDMLNEAIAKMKQYERLIEAFTSDKQTQLTGMVKELTQTLTSAK